MSATAIQRHPQPPSFLPSAAPHASTFSSSSSSSSRAESPAFGSDYFDEEALSVSSPGSVDVATPPSHAPASPTASSGVQQQQQPPQEAQQQTPAQSKPFHTDGGDDLDDLFATDFGIDGAGGGASWHFVQPESEDARATAASASTSSSSGSPVVPPAITTATNADQEDDLMLGLGLGFGDDATASSNINIDDDALLMSLLNADAMQQDDFGMGSGAASTSSSSQAGALAGSSLFSGDLTPEGLDHLMGFAGGSSSTATSAISSPWSPRSQQQRQQAAGGLQQTIANGQSSMAMSMDVDLPKIKTEPMDVLPATITTNNDSDAQSFFRGVVNPSAIFASESASATGRPRATPLAAASGQAQLSATSFAGSASSSSSSSSTLPAASPAQPVKPIAKAQNNDSDDDDQQDVDDDEDDDEPELRAVTPEEAQAASKPRKASTSTKKTKPRQMSTTSNQSDSMPPAGSYRPIDVSGLVSGDSEDLKALLALPAMFGGVKGKGGKKGGGLSSVVIENDNDRDEDDDWRPSPEEYKKLSSKEKRQLRNKLSARAFRNRRKNYVQELEGHIRDRDRLIDAVRRELGNARDEADELRREVALLKRAAAEPTPSALQRPSLAPDNGLAAAFGVQPTSPGSTAQAASQAIKQRLAQQAAAANQSSLAGSSPLSTFDPRKDASPSSLLSGSLSPKSIRKFWATDPSAGFGGAARYTSVQTALVPDLTLPSSVDAAARPGLPNFPRTNLNPAMNMSSSSSSSTSSATSPIDFSSPIASTSRRSSSATAASSAIGSTSSSSGDAFQPDLSTTFDSWAGANDFNLRSLDAYRMQLWSRMARDSALARSGVPAELRPKFLREPSGSIAAKNRAADATNASLGGGGDQGGVSPAAMASVVQQAITTRLFSAFVDAFRRPAGTGTGPGEIDADKVAAVFSGRSSIKIVPNSPVKPEMPKRTKSDSAVVKPAPASASATMIDADAALAAGFANLRVATQNLGMQLPSKEDNNVVASLNKDRPAHAMDGNRPRSLGSMFGLAK